MSISTLHSRQSGRARERGAAALIIVVVLLALLTITVLTVSRSILTELKVSSDQNREKEAFAAAQAGLDRGSQKFLASSAVTSFDTCGTSVALGTEGVKYCYSGNIVSGEATITGTGRSADESGTVSISEVFTISEAPDYGDLVPFLASSNIPTGGGFQLVPNPISGGDDVPVASWSYSAGTGGVANWDVCEYDEYLKDLCADRPYCTEDESSCPAIVQDSLVPDPFEVLFGEDMSECDGTTTSLNCPFERIKESYAGLFECGAGGADFVAKTGTFEEALSEARKNGFRGLPVIWVEESCDIKNPIGSANSPVVVVVEGDMNVQGGNAGEKFDYYGIFFALTNKYTASPSNDNETMVNGGTIHGSLLVNGTVKSSNGNGTVAYDPSVLKKMTEYALESAGLRRTRGTWRDF